MTRVIVPAKEPIGAKGRLAAALDPEQRQALAGVLLDRVLTALSRLREPVEVRVVTDSDDVEARARGRGVGVIREPGGRGEAAAVDVATAISLAEGCDRQLVIPADLAAPDPRELDALLARRLPPPSVILVPATGDDGTNAILSSPPDAIPFLFGPSSFERHQAAATRFGVRCEVMRLPSLVLDIDTPEDLSSAQAASAISVRAVSGVPEIRPGDDLGEILASAILAAGMEPADGDVIVVAQKVVSKAEGRIILLADVEPSAEARELAARVGKDPAKVHVILGESRRVVKAEWPEGRGEGLLIMEHKSGHVMANAGVDASNAAPGALILLPEDSAASAERVRATLAERLNANLGVVVSDTFGRPWRPGLVNVALAVAGMPAVVDLRGQPDDAGRALAATSLALADEVAAAAGLVIGKTNRSPAAIVSGLRWVAPDAAEADLVRPETEDLFR